MASKQRVLFLQLPQLDNDIAGTCENLPVAAAYLEHAARQQGEGAYYEFLHLPDAILQAGTQRLVEHIAALAPHVIACTVYLWNVEWTLRLLTQLHRRLPGLQSILGGPETAREHPFLFRRRVARIIVIGEGESVFPAILRGFRTGAQPDYTTVAVQSASGYRWGRRPPEAVDLEQAIPPVTLPACAPNADHMAYLEASRGCPMRCTYCRYPNLRRTLSFLKPSTVEARVRRLQRLGAREIRFTDPTFNAHPEFEAILRRLGRLNRSGTLRFFAEINGNRLTEAQADLLAAARFAELEIGLQSRDAAVLKAIRRPTDLPRLEQSVHWLLRRGITVTLDIMYGLPRQNVAEVIDSTTWALRFRTANIQCLQTLLLPGTELRARRAAWGMQASSAPPYAVTATDTMSAADFATVERLIAGHARLRSDVPTARLVGHRLPDLFADVVSVDAATSGPVPGGANRRAVIIRGPDLFGQRQRIALLVRRMVRQEPDTLFQFVLAVSHEEPLDLFDALIAALRSCPPHLTDRYAAVAAHGKLAARRLLVQLPRRRRLSPDWVKAADDLLGTAFF